MSNNHGDAAAVALPIPPGSTLVDGHSPRKGPAFWLNAWWPVAIGISVIMLESTPWMGADHTSGPLRRLYTFFFGPISNAAWDNIHHYIRKSGHFFGYGALCLTWLRAWRVSFPRFRFAVDAILAILATAVIAGGDEFHQRFLPNRGSSPFDVLLDCCGAITMTILTWLIMRLFFPRLLQS